MKIMIFKIGLSVATLLVSLSSFAGSKMDLICHQGELEDCEVKVEEALTKAGCELEADVLCQVRGDSDGEFRTFCDVVTANCASPVTNLFGWEASAVYCESGKKTNLFKFDRDITQSWVYGFENTYVEEVCVD